MNGVAFCHWDRWLLRLALDTHNGLAGMRAEFRARSKKRNESVAAEALIAQIDDLQARLSALAMTPAEVLDDEERASEWLKRKAMKRVWRDGPHTKTKAMMNPPKRMLAQRALRGHWAQFPVNPARYEALFAPLIRDAQTCEWSGVSFLAHTIDGVVERESRRTRCTYKLLALHRCALTTIFECMEHVDDSGSDMAMVCASIERSYLDLTAASAWDAVFVDMLELHIWDDYNLLEPVESFLRAMPEEMAYPTARALEQIIAELRAHELDYQHDRARRLRSALFTSIPAEALDVIE
ncbi:MAG: hypothetical protein JNK05_39480 [Myxococcales bacterium]|nr:hypothetical protein [Myxococcales bacterium]